jgi:hypothetical protein
MATFRLLPYAVGVATACPFGSNARCGSMADPMGGSYPSWSAR